VQSRAFPRLAVAGVTTTAALLGSLLVTSPAYADTTLSGVVLDGSTPVYDTNVMLIKLGTDITRTEALDTYTDESGMWTLNGELEDGAYALFYAPYGEDAPYSTAQAWNGKTNPFAVDAQFTVSGGVASQSSFTQVLTHNAGVVSVALVDDSGALVSSTDERGPVDAYVNIGYPDLELESMLFAGGYTQSESATDGVVDIAHVPAAYWAGGYGDAYFSNQSYYSDDYLDPFQVTPGGTTRLSLRLHDSSAPGVYDLLEENVPSEFIPGTPKVGQLLTAAASPVAGVTFSYQWYRGIYSGGLPSPIAGANQPSYVPTADDLGANLTVMTIARASGYESASFAAVTLRKVALGDPNAPTVGIVGTPTVGSKLKATVSGGIAGANNSYQWYRDGAPIVDADGSAYVPTADDRGHALMVAVTSVVQGHTNGTIPSPAVTVAKDAAQLTAKATAKKFTTKKKAKVEVRVAASPSNADVAGTVTVTVNTKKGASKTVSVSSKPVTVNLGKLKKDTYTVTVSYSGNAAYDAASTSTKVKVVKAGAGKHTGKGDKKDGDKGDKKKGGKKK
jgi:hypothetical protein